MVKLQSARAFSMIELLVAIAIIVMLASLSMVGYSKYMQSANKGKELHAARVLMAGFHAHAADHAGKIMKAMDNNPGQVLDKQGRPVMSHAAKRWPWRLAPYINYNMDMIMVNNQEAAPLHDAMYSYLVTVFPTMGLNGTFVGGKFGTIMAPDHPRGNKDMFCVTHIVQPHKPSQLIVFASAKMHSAPHAGCFDVCAPGFGAVGEVDYKYAGAAVVAYFDGHVEMNDANQLKDMRRWSNLAAMQNDADWNF